MSPVLISRIISAITLLPVAFAYIFFSHFAIILPIHIIGVLILAYELHRLSINRDLTTKEGKEKKITDFISYGFIFCGALISGYVLINDPIGKVAGVSIEEFLLYLMTAQFLVICFVQIFFFKNFLNLFRDQQSYIFVFFYVNFILFHLLKLKYFFIYQDPELSDLGNYYILLIFLIAWFYDSFAYLFGNKWGTKKIGLLVSEKKSWVGLIAGLISTFLAGALVSNLLNFFEPVLWQQSIFAEGMIIFLLFPLLGLVAQWGDLIASLHKRSSGVKDSGSLMKEHGGFYDRNDSVIIVGLVMYYFLVYYY